MSQDWNISACAHQCASTGTPFPDGTPIVSCLRFGEDGYYREDYAAEAWQEEQRQDAVSVWKSTYQAPPPKAEEPLHKETVESLLRKLIETDEPSEERVIYILALMLERKRVLVERDVHQREDGRTVRVYERRKTGESFMIPDPMLKLSEIEAVQQEVAERLGLPPQGGEPEQVAEGEPAAEAD